MLPVAQQPSAGQFKATTAGERTAAVIDHGRLRTQACTCNQTLDVSEYLVDTQCQALVAEQATTAVIQVARHDIEGLATGDFTGLVVHTIEMVEHQRPGRVDEALLVVELAIVQVQGQARVAEQLATLLIKPIDAGRQDLGTADVAGAVVQ